jgi:hypothetical protein
VTGDLDGLARGRRVVLQERGQITITAIPVPAKTAEAAAVPGRAGRYHVHAGPTANLTAAHLVIDSLPARTDISEVDREIAGRASRPSRPGTDTDRSPGTLPIAYLKDQSRGIEVRILITLHPGTDPAEAAQRLASIRGMSAETTCAFPAPLAGLLRSWVKEHRDEDLAASLDELEKAVRADGERARQHYGR